MRLNLRCAMRVFAATVILLSGCTKITTDYGKTKGLSGRTSLNGFGALRVAFEQAGFRNRDVSRLSDRVTRTDVIVWTPQVLGSVDTKVTRWFERWLGRGDRTLVYIVPDSGSEAEYWADAAKLAPPDQRLEYRKRAARSTNERMMWRLNRVQVQSNGWFRIEPLVQRREIGDISGPWKQDIGNLSGEDSGNTIEHLLVAYDREENKKAKKKAKAVFPGSGPTGPGSPGFSMPTNAKPTSTPIVFSNMVSTGTGDPIVAEITSKRWKNSRIIVVAGGSLLTNYAFTRPRNRRLAEKIIAESTPPRTPNPSAGFLTSNWNQVPVSESKPGIPKASGMELLTVWPISLVTMHGVMLGLVICLMLLPIFGRPRRIRRSKHSDFGHHLDAVAALMNKAGGERYARSRISEYMKRMHGETSGPWVLPDLPVQKATTNMPPLTSKRQRSATAASENPSRSATAAADDISDIVEKPTDESEPKDFTNDEAER